MQQKLFIAAAALLVASAPVTLAGHGQLGDSMLLSYPFQAIQDTYIGFDWAGVGGSGGDGTLAPHGSNNLGPAPDDCYDIDDYYGRTFLKVAYPSVSVQSTVDRQTLVPGQSVAAPSEAVLACTMAREILFGQETGHAYESPQQQIGFGDFEVEVQAVVSSAGFFDTALVGVPSSLTVKYCTATFVDTTSVGNENWAGNGLPNGALTISGAPSCDDLTGDYLAHLADNPGQQWDAGRFNRINNGNVYRQSVADDADGLKIMCVSFDVLDGNSAAAGFFEDYSYFFVENVDANVVTDFWSDPREHSDGGALGQDCNSLGISL